MKTNMISFLHEECYKNMENTGKMTMYINGCGIYTREHIFHVPNHLMQKTT